MGRKRTQLFALLGVAALGACSTVQGSKARTYVSAPLFVKPPEADAFSAVLIARYAQLNNDPAEAVARYADVLDTLPDGDPIASRGVFAALMAGDFDQAVAFARKARAGGAGGSSLSALTLSVHAMTGPRGRAGGPRLALDDYGPFNRAMAINLEAWRVLGADGLAAAEAVLQAAQGDGFAVHTVTLAMAGLMQLAAGEDARALATFERIDAIGPRLAIASDAQARLLAASGQRDRALERLAAFRAEVGSNPQLAALERAIAAGETVQPPRLSPAEGAALGIYAPAAALAARSDRDLAGVYFALALELDPTLDVARTLWADTLGRNGRRAEAIALLGEITPASPFYATARGQMAWALRREGDVDGALAAAREALARADDRDLRIQLGDLLVSAGDDRAAEAVFDRLIAEDTAAGRQNWRLLFARGAVRDRLGNWPDAERDLLAALELAPDDPDLLNHLGYGWVERGRNLEDAVSMLERAARLKPEAGHIIDSLGWAYFQAGRYEEAIVCLEQAVELEPTSPVANDHLGDAYWRVGRRLEASYQWERALTLAPGARQAARLERKLVAGLPPKTGGLVGASLSAPGGLTVQP